MTQRDKPELIEVARAARALLGGLDQLVYEIAEPILPDARDQLRVALAALDRCSA